MHDPSSPIVDSPSPTEPSFKEGDASLAARPPPEYHRERRLGGATEPAETSATMVMSGLNDFPLLATRPLGDIHRVLKLDGSARIVVPDAGLAVLAYAEGAASYFKLARALWHPPQVVTPMEHLNWTFRAAYAEHVVAILRERLAQYPRRNNPVRTPTRSG